MNTAEMINFCARLPREKFGVVLTKYKDFSSFAKEAIIEKYQKEFPVKTRVKKTPLKKESFNVNYNGSRYSVSYGPSKKDSNDNPNAEEYSGYVFINLMGHPPVQLNIKSSINVKKLEEVNKLSTLVEKFLFLCKETKVKV